MTVAMNQCIEVSEYCCLSTLSGLRVCETAHLIRTVLWHTIGSDKCQYLIFNTVTNVLLMRFLDLRVIVFVFFLTNCNLYKTTVLDIYVNTTPNINKLYVMQLKKKFPGRLSGLLNPLYEF